MTTVYLVVGSSGSYEDYQEWVARAFFSSAQAKNVCNALRMLTAELQKQISQECRLYREGIDNREGSLTIHNRLREIDYKLEPATEGSIHYSNINGYTIKEIQVEG